MKRSNLVIRQIVASANEMSITVNGEHFTLLLDIGSIVRTMVSSLCHSLGLKIKSLNNFLTAQSAGGHTVPYDGYVEVRLSIP